jgi:hypothetical protein
MKRCWRVSRLGLFVAVLVGLTVWGGADWLLAPKPRQVIVKNYPHYQMGIIPREQFINDSTGWWIAKYDGVSLEGPGDWWHVYNLKNGEVSHQLWDTDYDKPSVPIPNGYRHVRTAPDGLLEIVDTLFSDGTSTVRLRLPPGTRIARCMLFNHDGSRAVTLHPFPHSLLRVLGNVNGPAWDAFWVTDLQAESDKTFPDISVDALQAKVWDVSSAQCTKVFALPPLTTTAYLQLSPNGRWLVRPETPLIKEHCGDLFDAALPRGILVFDCDTGRKVHIPVSYKDPRAGAFVVFVRDSGCAFQPGMTSSLDIPILFPRSSITSAPMTDEDFPLCRFPDGLKVPWIGIDGSHSATDIAPLRTIDGYDVNTMQTERSGAVAILRLDGDGIHICSKPVELNADHLIDLEATNQPGQVLASWSTHQWPTLLADVAYKFGLNLNDKFPCKPSISFALVDVHQAKILLEDHISYDKNESSPEYKLTHDGSAILLTQRKDRDLHIWRWDLPISIWSPWWGRGAGLVSALIILFMMRHKVPLQDSANLSVASTLSPPDRFACGQAVS